LFKILILLLKKKQNKFLQFLKSDLQAKAFLALLLKTPCAIESNEKVLVFFILLLNYPVSQDSQLTATPNTRNFYPEIDQFWALE